MVFERGPSEPSEMPMAPRVMDGPVFANLIGGLAPMLGGADDAMAAVVRDLAPLTQRDLSPDFNALVGPAFESVDTLEDSADGSTMATTLGGLDATAIDIDGQRADLPGPDSTEPADESDQPFENQVGGPDPGGADDPRNQD